MINNKYKNADTLMSINTLLFLEFFSNFGVAFEHFLFVGGKNNQLHTCKVSCLTDYHSGKQSKQKYLLQSVSPTTPNIFHINTGLAVGHISAL